VRGPREPQRAGLEPALVRAVPLRFCLSSPPPFFAASHFGPENDDKGLQFFGPWDGSL
jgi:hypothetical protein